MIFKSDYGRILKKMAGGRLTQKNPKKSGLISCLFFYLFINSQNLFQHVCGEIFSIGEQKLVNFFGILLFLSYSKMAVFDPDVIGFYFDGLFGCKFFSFVPSLIVGLILRE